MDAAMVLSVVALASIHLLFVMVMLKKVPELWWLITYFAMALFYAARYFLRLRNLRPGLRRRLRNAAIALGAFLSAFFFYNFAAGMSWWTAIAVWLGLAVASHLFFDVVMLDTEEAQRVRPPV